MPYEKDFIAARKKYLDVVMPLRPTTTLKTFVDEEKPKMLAKGLDDAAGNLDKMRTAHVAYNNYYRTYIGKIDTQIKKETVDKNKLKVPLNVYEHTLKAFSDAYLKDFETQRKEEERKASAAAGARDAVSAGANAAAAAGAARNLKKSLEDFKAKRTLHLNAITELGREVDEAALRVRTWHATARDSVTEALNFAKAARLDEARRVADAALAAAQSAATLSAKLNGDYEKKITQTFQKDRNLGFLSYESSHGLLKTQEQAFKTGQVEAKAIFDRAVELGTTTLAKIKNMVLLAKQAEEAATAADHAANVKDIKPAIRSSLEAAQRDVDALAGKITEQINNHRSGSGLLPSGQAILDRAAVPGTRPEAVRQAPVKAQGIEEMITKIGGWMNQAEQITKAQIGKVPPQLKTDDEFKNALARLATAAGAVKRAYNQFMNDGNAMASKLKALR